MNAVISGYAGTAFVIDDEDVTSLDVADLSTPVQRSAADFPYLFGEMTDLRFLENTTADAIRDELQRDSDLALALELALISLDQEFPEDIRSEAITELDKLVTNPLTKERLENVLYSSPLTGDADLATALKLCDETNATELSILFQLLGSRQDSVIEVKQAWDAISSDVFGDEPDDREAFLRACVDSGQFRALAVCRVEKTRISDFLIRAGLNPTVNKLHNFRQVMQRWTASFPRAVSHAAIQREVDEKREETVRRRRRGRRIDLDRAEMFNEVNRRKEIIIAALHRRDLALVDQLTDDLVSYQRSAEPVHIAKSLCDLAMEAKSLGMFPVQLKLTSRSIQEAPDDAWSWAQHGDALLNVNRLKDALRAYRQAESFGAGAMALKGRGEVLKAQGRLREALAAFDEVIREHPDDPVAKNGRAEVLKAQGRLPEALAAFDRIIAEHPEDVVAKNGRAEVLKAQGRLTDALAAFEETSGEHPENVVAKAGRAEVLKTQGRLTAALAAFEETIREHPENVVAKNGRAEVLKAQGRLTDALAAFEETIQEHPENVVAKSGRAEVLKAQGRLADALATFEEIQLQFPNDLVARNGRSCVLAALGRYEHALQALPDRQPLGLENWIGYHIRGMILLRMGNQSESIRIFSEGVLEDPFYSSKEFFRSALALAWLRGKEFSKASQLLDEVTSPLLQPVANVLRIHAFGAQGQKSRAFGAYNALKRTFLRSHELTQELHSQFILENEPRHNDEWLIDRESRIVLLAA